MPRADAFSVFRSNEQWQRKKRGRPRRNDCDNPLQSISDEAIAAALNATDGIIKDAAVKLRCSYYTIEPRIRKSPVLRQICEAYRLRSFDFTESNLRKANKKGEVWAVKEMLKYRGHHHGYTEKTQTELSGSVAFTREGIESLTDEELDALLIRIDRRIAALAQGEGAATKGQS